MSRRRQPHRIPPPISYGSESLDAEIVLHEESGELALLLWKTLRSVRLWCELPADQRPQVFGAEAYDLRLRRLATLDADTDLEDTLETAASLLKGEDAHVAAVVTACRLLGAWAERRGSLGTALEFTQAAALLSPGDAELVLSVATLARARGELARAESWYRQAIAVGRRTHDWISLSGAYLGIGRTFLDGGNLPAARQALVRGIRAATRHSLWQERALLAHEYVRYAIAAGRPADVMKAGRAALEAYTADSAGVHQLAADLGAYWVRSGHPAPGRGVLAALSTTALDPESQLEVAGALALAAAAEGDAAGYESAANRVRSLLSGSAPARASAGAWMDLARGALLLDDRALAVEAAEAAQRAAELRGGPELRGSAGVVLRAARGEMELPREPAIRGVKEIRALAGALEAAVASSALAA